MEEKDRTPVLERLRELEGWSEYIAEALHINQRNEPVKREMLERTLGEEALKQIRELSWSLRDQLHVVTTQLELTRPEGRAMGASERAAEEVPTPAGLASDRAPSCVRVGLATSPARGER